MEHCTTANREAGSKTSTGLMMVGAALGLLGMMAGRSYAEGTALWTPPTTVRTAPTEVLASSTVVSARPSSEKSWGVAQVVPAPDRTLPSLASALNNFDLELDPSEREALEALTARAEDPSLSPQERLTSLFQSVTMAIPLLVTLFGIARHKSSSVGDTEVLTNDIKPTDTASMNRWIAGIGAMACLFMMPMAANAGTAGSVMEATFGSGFVQAFSLIFLSEVGDKTFFIAGLLAVKYGRLVSFCGSMGALSVMSVISVLLGQVFHAVPSSLTNGLALDDYAAIILFTYFGVQTIKEAASLPSDGEGKMAEELDEAEEEVEAFGNKLKGGQFWTLVVSTFTLIFAAEFGDKSFLATIGLSAAQNPVSVTFGAIAGHGLATLIAVVSGSIISKYLSERVLGYIGGSLFLTFAITTFLNLFGISIPIF